MKKRKVYKLTKGKVTEIVKLVNKGDLVKTLAYRFDVTHQSISLAYKARTGMTIREYRNQI